MLRMPPAWVPLLVESRPAERCQKQCSAAASSQESTAGRAIWAEQGGAQDAPERVAGILGDTLDRRELILVFSADKSVAARRQTCAQARDSARDNHINILSTRECRVSLRSRPMF